MIEANAVSSSPMADLKRRLKAGAGGARLTAPNRAYFAGQLAALRRPLRSCHPWKSAVPNHSSHQAKPVSQKSRFASVQTGLNRHS